MASELIWFDVKPTASNEPPALVLLSSTRGELARTELTEDSLRALIGTLIASLQKLDAPAMAKIGRANAFDDPPVRVSSVAGQRTILFEVEAIPGISLSFAWSPRTAGYIAAMIKKIGHDSPLPPGAAS